MNTIDSWFKDRTVDGGPGSGPRRGGGRAPAPSGYVAGRIGQHKIIQGIGTRGGEWAAHGRGETKWFKKREHAEEHANLSSEDSGPGNGPRKGGGKAASRRQR